MRPQKEKIFKLLLAFSGAFLLSITVFELVPEVFEDHSGKTPGIFIMCGIFLQIFLEFFSKGAEHGHIHHSPGHKSFPWMLFISLSIHSVLEGIPIYHHNTLIYGIVIHKLPIAIVLTTFFVNSNIDKWKMMAFMILFAFMTPLGTFLSTNLHLIEEFYMPINALIIGIFLHISTIILFESAEGHKFNITKLVVIIAGILTAYVL
ncbi:ZIP family metal transporter [Sinomicrobium sp.]